MQNKYYFLISYFLILFSFPFLQKLYIPKPNLKKLELITDVKDYVVKKNNFDQDMNNSLKRKISIGDTYFITDSSNTTFQITPISKWSMKDLNLQTIAEYLPTLIIQNSEIKKVNNNNYAVGKIQKKSFSQACVLNTNSYFFDNSKLYVPQYWEIKYWIEIINNSLKSLIYFNPKTENCLLITSSDLDNFQNDVSKVYKLIDIK